MATLQLKSVPASLKETMTESQWEILFYAEVLNQILILDTHFEGMTVLNDVEPAEHHGRLWSGLFNLGGG